MFDKDNIFNFFKNKKKKDPMAVKAGKITLKAFGNIFKFFSYLLGSIFFLGIGMGIWGNFNKQDRIKHYEAVQNQLAQQKKLNSQLIGKFNIELINIIKEQKNPTVEKTIELINQKFKTQIQYKFTDKDTIIFTRSLDYIFTRSMDYEKVEYVVSLSEKNIRLLDSTPEIVEEFKKYLKDDKSIVWHQNENTSLDKNLRSQYLSISLKE